MLDTLTDLSTLHALHLELQEVNDELDRGPRQINVRKKRVAQAKQQVADREATLKQARSLGDQKSMDLKSREAKVADLTAKLNQSTSNKEYDAIKSQIAADEAASSVLEDESLEAMERIDATLADLENDKKAVATAEQELRETEEKFAKRKVELDAQAAELAEKIKLSESIVPAGQAREDYRRLAANVGADSMAPIEDGVCTGCYTAVPMQARVLLNQGEIVFCGSCRRLLYKPAEAPRRR